MTPLAVQNRVVCFDDVNPFVAGVGVYVVVQKMLCREFLLVDVPNEYTPLKTLTVWTVVEFVQPSVVSCVVSVFK